VLDLFHLEIGALEEVLDEDAHFIRRDVPFCSDSPVIQDPGIVRNAQNDVGVPNVNAQQLTARSPSPAHPRLLLTYSLFEMDG
jgi:hypothetical protein